MRKAIIAIVASWLLVAAMAGPALAEAWSYKITGGGEAFAGQVFYITASASDTGGQIQYSRANGSLSFHAAVERTEVSADAMSAMACGPAFAQEGSLADGIWATINVKEGGDGSGDRVRVTLGFPGDPTFCDLGTVFPGVMTDGNFNIRGR